MSTLAGGASVASAPDGTTPDLSRAPVLLIQPSRGRILVRFREVWEYRELLSFLTLKHVKVRYKQTVLGVAWAILQPLFTMVIFSLFFGKLAKMPSDGVPYPIFTFAALVPWTFFSQGLNLASNSLVGNSNLLKKVYFPRLIIPLSTVLSGVIDFALALLILLVMMASYGIAPTVKVVWLPLFLLLAFVTSLGIGVWLSAMNVQFRDVRFIVPFLTQVWLFATPIAYPSSLLEQPWRTVYGLNPLVGVVEGFRWALLGAGSPPGPMVLASCVTATALLFGGVYYFCRMERTFADVV